MAVINWPNVVRAQRTPSFEKKLVRWANHYELVNCPWMYTATCTPESPLKRRFWVNGKWVGAQNAHQEKKLLAFARCAYTFAEYTHWRTYDDPRDNWTKPRPGRNWAWTNTRQSKKRKHNA